MPLESRDFESEISQHPCYKLQTRHEDIQGFEHLMPSRYFDANSNYVWQPETVEGLKIGGGRTVNIFNVILILFTGVSLSLTFNYCSK